MEAMTISQVSKGFNISTRTLRYYEQIGLIKSIRKMDYAYRTYDEDAIRRLRQIIVLRKLRIPLKHIDLILGSCDMSQAIEAIELFMLNIAELDEEIAALSTIKAILQSLVERLKNNGNTRLMGDAFLDEALSGLVSSLALSKIALKEERPMEELNKANENLSKLSDVRIIYLPPATVAASHFIGNDPEDKAGDALDAFVRECKLWEVKPDMRLYGFNHPNPVDETNFHGYEFWVTIPEDMEVKPPLVKKSFEGGLFAAHMIQMGNFHEWGWLDRWVRENGRYVYRGDGNPENMFGSLEEHLNYITHVQKPGEMPPDMQLDLLIPVRDRDADGKTS